MKKKDYSGLAKELVKMLGGKENISSCYHCVTRLRFNLKDIDLANMDAIKKLDVLGVQLVGPQLQVIIGADVNQVYDAVCNIADIKAEAAIDENLDQKKNSFSLKGMLDTLSACIIPILPIMITGGMLKFILMIIQMTGIMEATNSTYLILSFAGDAAFYFLPVFIGASTAKKLKGNMFLGMLIGAILISPAFISMVSEGTKLTMFGIPVYAGTYSSSVFPALLSVALMCFFERKLDKIISPTFKAILIPTLCILIMLPLSLIVIAPLGAYIGEYMSTAVIWLYDKIGFLMVGLLAAVWPWITMAGMHMSFLPYALQSFSTLTYEPLVSVASLLYNMSMGSASAAVAIKTKNKNLKGIAFSGAVSAIFAAVTEPALFGIGLNLKKPLYATMIGSLVGGLYAGFMHVYCRVMGVANIFGIFAFVGPNYAADLINVIISVILSLIVTFVLTYFWYRDENKMDSTEYEI